MQYRAIETRYAGYRFRSRIEARWAVFFDTLGIKYQYELEGFELDNVWYLPDFWLPEQQYWIEIKGQEPTKEEIDKAHLLSIYMQKPVYIFWGDAWIPHKETKSAIKIGDHYILGRSADDHDIYMREKRIEKRCEEDSEFTLDDACEEKDMQTDCILPQTPPHIMALFYQLKKEAVFLLVRKDKLYIEAPLNAPSPKNIGRIQEYEQELISLLSYQRMWRWEMEDLSDFSRDVHWWCECPRCKNLGVTDQGYAYRLPCKCLKKEEEIKLKGLTHYTSPTEIYNSSQTHQSPRLVSAYTTARQARFEHGEKPR